MVKFLSTQLSYFLGERQARQNVRALLRYVGFVFGVIALYAVLFHWIMLYAEGEEHSWVTGVYWVLTVMSTLGFGDITFESDVGRLFSIVVLVSGIVLLLIVLPFAFIRFFFAPWLEAQVRLRIPRRVSEEVSGHVILCHYDPVAAGLIERLRAHGIPYAVLEPDPAAAARLLDEGVSVVAGEIDALATYEAARVRDARAVFANGADTTNTNITLTVRQIAPDVPILAVAENAPSVDLLELSGATHVLALKDRLGEHLANRVNAGHAQAHEVGTYRDFVIAEFPAHATPFVGRTIRDTRLGEALGVHVVGVWERGRLLPPSPDTTLTDSSVVIVLGTREQMLELDTLLVIYDTNYNPVIVVGGGRVGRATVSALKRRGLTVHVVDRDPTRCGDVARLADRVFQGDAAERELLMEAGLAEAPSVILTTNDDAMNIYLAVYCRRLNPELRIVSRVVHERNVEAIHRAGADLALSYASLGVESAFALLQGREISLLGEGVEIFTTTLPPALAGRTIGESGIRTKTGLSVIAVQQNGGVLGGLRATTVLEPGSELVLLGTSAQRAEFQQLYR